MAPATPSVSHPCHRSPGTLLALFSFPTCEKRAMYVTVELKIGLMLPYFHNKSRSGNKMMQHAQTSSTRPFPCVVFPIPPNDSVRWLTVHHTGLTRTVPCVGRRPIKPKVIVRFQVAVPSRGGYQRQLIDVSLSHHCFSPSLSPTLPLSLKIKSFVKSASDFYILGKYLQNLTFCRWYPC